MSAFWSGFTISLSPKGYSRNLFHCPSTISKFGTGNWSVSYNNDSGHRNRHRRFPSAGSHSADRCFAKPGNFRQREPARTDPAHRRRSLSQSCKPVGGRLLAPPFARFAPPSSSAGAAARHLCGRERGGEKTSPGG